MTAQDSNLSMEQRRRVLTEHIIAKGVALSPAVVTAFETVPRHLFVPGVFPEIVYRDVDIVTRRDKYGVPLVRSTQPSVMGRMLTAAAIEPGHNVLEIGTGTGYNAAMLAELVGETGQVTTIELDPDAAEAAEAHLERAGYTGIRLVRGDGAFGNPEYGPYDRIIATSSVWDVPSAWLDQLREDGLLVTPLGFGTIQVGAVLRKRSDGGLESVELFPPAFIPIRGEAAGPDRHTTIPGSALHIDFVENPSIDEARIHTLLSEDHEINQLPLELDRENLGHFSYHMLFHQPSEFALITYRVEEGQMAFGLTLFGWGIISPTSACLVPYGDELVVHTYGSADAYLAMADLARQWSAIGQPDLDDYELRVTPAGQRHFLPDGQDQLTRVFVRPSHTFTLWRKAAQPTDT